MVARRFHGAADAAVTPHDAAAAADAAGGPPTGAATDAVRTRPPRVFIAANFLSSGGGSRSVVEDLAERLRARGYELVTASGYRNGLLRSAHMLATATLRRGSYDVAVVDLYSGRAFLIGEALSVALKALGRPFVLVLRGGALPQFSARRGGRVRACLARAAAVAAPSPYLLEEMRPFHDALRLLPNPVDLAAYDARVRRATSPRLVWLRSFHEIYNPTLAPKVVALLAKDFPGVSLTMVGRDTGDGSLRRTREVASALGVADRISFPGGVPKRDVPAWLDGGDIFLNTTDVDNTPVSVLEALACGMCVVSTNVGGVPRLLEDGRDALLVPPRDAAAMASAVGRLLDDPALAERLSREGRRKAERFDWSLVMPQWESLFESLSGRGEGAA
ncbi:MAG TPA: glycosyltransferase family 4 protein [Pyrinomonadaceae bacterium]|nr:glycosyltransferase family 4 protein [Pyrinomonadaceae bacterium]